MDSQIVWLNIIVPLIIGPIFIFLKTIYDNFKKNKTSHQLMVYKEKISNLDNLLNNFYWKLYVKLLCISKLNYSLPLQNEYNYESDCEDCETTNEENITVKNALKKEIIIDKDTIKLMENNINELFDEILQLLENNISYYGHNTEINKEIINFIIYCKFRNIIHEGSINCVYNIEYFGINNNTPKLLSLITTETFKYQHKYNLLIEKGPF